MGGVWYCLRLLAPVWGGERMMRMRLAPLLKPECVICVDEAVTRDELLEMIAERAAGHVPGQTKASIFEGILTREEQMPTATAEGVAFPHTLLEGVEETLVVACRLKKGAPFAPGKHPDSTVVFAMVGSKDRPFEHVRLLARLAQIAQESGTLERIRDAENEGALYDVLLAEDKAHG